MIRVYKRHDAPEALEARGYNHDEVKRALLEDQHEKCYLCERKLTTDYQVEHIVSQKGDESKINDWDNLFVACNYCNDRKKNNFDDIPLPDSMNFEDVIQQGCDMASKTAIFTTSEDDNKVKKLVSLLDRLYNGKNPGKRNLMEERFWNLFVDDYVGFLGRLHAYIDNRNQDTYQLVVDDLYQDAPILGFKYNFIKHNTELFDIFKDKMKWKKPSHTH